MHPRNARAALLRDAMSLFLASKHEERAVFLLRFCVIATAKSDRRDTGYPSDEFNINDRPRD